MRVEFSQHCGRVTMYLRAESDHEAVLLAVLRNQAQELGHRLAISSSTHEMGKVGDRALAIDARTDLTLMQRLRVALARRKLR